MIRLYCKNCKIELRDAVLVKEVKLRVMVNWRGELYTDTLEGEYVSKKEELECPNCGQEITVKGN